MLNLTAGNLTQEEQAIYYSYRGKGGKHGKRELPQPAFRAIQQALAAFGKDLATMKPEEPVWPSSADSGAGSPEAPSTVTSADTSRQWI